MNTVARMFAFVALLAVGACSSLPYDTRPPKVSLSQVDLKSLGIFEQRFDVGLRLRNPNDFDLKIEAIEFDLEVNERPFATGLSRTSTLVPSLSSTVVHVEAVTESRNLMRQFSTLPGEMLRKGVPYRIKGRVKIDKTSRWIPFDHNGVYGRDAQKPKSSDEDGGRAI